MYCKLWFSYLQNYLYKKIICMHIYNLHYFLEAYQKMASINSVKSNPPIVSAMINWHK